MPSASSQHTRPLGCPAPVPRVANATHAAATKLCALDAAASAVATSGGERRLQTRAAGMRASARSNGFEALGGDSTHAHEGPAPMRREHT
eukprot:5093327-Prymnesium_polylepis.1